MFQTWPRGGPMSYGYILQAVAAPWNYSATNQAVPVRFPVRYGPSAVLKLSAEIGANLWDTGTSRLGPPPSQLAILHRLPLCLDRIHRSSQCPLMCGVCVHRLISHPPCTRCTSMLQEMGTSRRKSAIRHKRCITRALCCTCTHPLSL